MDTTRTNVNRTTNSRSTYLPNITSSQTVSYAQRYEHMTKIANYNQMNEGQIWKQYEKLRVCLKELNQQVLHHMEKKASLNLYAKEAPMPPSVEATLLLLDQQRKTNDSRLQIFLNEAASLEQRVQHLTNKTEYLQDINSEIQITEAKIKQITLQNKDMKRKQKMTSKDLLTGPSFLQKLVIEEQALHYARRKYEKYEQIYKQAQSKSQDFNQKTAEYQSVFETRVSQYKQQEGYIVEELNLQRFQQLQGQKQNLQKYETVYKRNYLMKLKQLQNIVNSINRHDQVIQETQINIRGMRSQIDQISAIVVKNSNNRRRSSMSMVQNGGSKSGRKSIMIDPTNNGGGVSQQEIESKNIQQNEKNNDKNRPPIPRN